MLIENQLKVSKLTASYIAELTLSVNPEQEIFPLYDVTIDWGNNSILVLESKYGVHTGVYQNIYSAPGNYDVVITVQDKNVDGKVSTSKTNVYIPSTNEESKSVIYGPILPKDSGFPNADQWTFDFGNNLDMIASSVKNILSTKKGERLMNPTFGTKLHLLVFETNDTILQSLAKDYVKEALAEFEPRAKISSIISKKGSDSKSLEIYLELSTVFGNFNLSQLVK